MSTGVTTQHFLVTDQERQQFGRGEEVTIGAFPDLAFPVTNLLP